MTTTPVDPRLDPTGRNGLKPEEYSAYARIRAAKEKEGYGQEQDSGDDTTVPKMRAHRCGIGLRGLTEEELIGDL